MDKALIRQRFAKATDSYDRQAGMQKHVARHMAEAIKRHISDSDGWNVLEIGCGTGLFTREYLREVRPGRLLLNDICPEVEPYLSGLRLYDMGHAGAHQVPQVRQHHVPQRLQAVLRKGRLRLRDAGAEKGLKG